MDVLEEKGICYTNQPFEDPSTTEGENPSPTPVAPEKCASAESLPLELWIEILSYVAWKDVLAFRMACKFMADISTARPVWVSQYRSLCASVTTPPGWGKHEIYASSRDLELVTLDRFKREILWKVPHYHMHVTPNIEIPPMPGLVAVGARWVLVHSRHGRRPILVYDMWNPLDIPHALTELSDTFDNIKNVSLPHIDVDYTQPRLVFHLCFAVHLYHGTIASSGVIVYRVVQSGTGIGATLQASKANSFLTPVRGTFGDRLIDFRGRYYLRHFLPANGLGLRLEIFDWVRSNSERHVMAIVDMSDEPAIFYRLLPNAQLLVSKRSGISMFNISTLTYITSHKVLSLKASLTPFWRDRQYPPGGDRYLQNQVSIPAFHLPSKSIRVAYTFGKEIYGIIAPPLGQGPPEHVKLSENVRRGNWIIGADKYIYLDTSNCIVRGSLCWPGDEFEHHTEAHVQDYLTSPQQTLMGELQLLQMDDFCTSALVQSHHHKSFKYAIIHV